MLENSNQTTQFSGNIDLSALRKKRFTVDNNTNRILELDTSDLSIVTRLSTKYPELEELGREVESITNGVSATDDSVQADLKLIGDKLAEIDGKMRACIDYIFDSNVCEICVPSGSMYDPIGGQLRYEHLITILVGLYESNLSEEMKRVQARIKTHTDKYTK